MARLNWVAFVPVVLLCGCAATSIMRGATEPDFSKVQPADKRSHVESALGERLWRVGSADGVTYDIYQYEADRPAQPLRGAGFFVAEAITFGTEELELGLFRESWPIKQVAVGYDAQDRVRFVSSPWSVNAAPPCRRMRSLLPSNSGIPSTAHPSPMADPGAPASELAIVRIGWGYRGIGLTVDGHKADKRVFELSPGHHKVNAEPTSILHTGSDADVELFAGRFYSLKSDSYMTPSEFVDFYWIEDVDSGETIHCFDPRYRPR